MYARLINILFRTETLPDVVHRFRTVSVPMISAHAGSAGIVATQNPESGRIYLMTIWDSEESRAASAVHPDFMQNMVSYADWMAGGFNRESFDVVGDTLHEYFGGDSDAPAIARYTFVTVDPDGWSAATPAYLQLLHADAYQLPGFQGAVLLANETLGRLILIDLWETRAQIVETDGEIFSTSHALQLSGAISAVPTHDVQDVVSRV
jgi:hypothetical protein